jgi:hypothetical protein
MLGKTGGELGDITADDLKDGVAKTLTVGTVVVTGFVAVGGIALAFVTANDSITTTTHDEIVLAVVDADVDDVAFMQG